VINLFPLQILGVSLEFHEGKNDVFCWQISILNPEMAKAGIHMKAVFWLGIMFLMQISRLRFKSSRISMLIPHIYVLGRFLFFFFGSF